MRNWHHKRIAAGKEVIYSNPALFRSLQLAWHALIFPRQWTRSRVRERQLRSFTEPRWIPIERDGVAFKILIRPENGLLDETVFATGQWDHALSTVMCRLLRPGDVFVDVGANIGYFSLLAATRVGPSGKVFAFEPIPQLVEQFRASVAANDLGNISIVQAACGAAPGTALLSVHDRNIGASSLRLDVAGKVRGVESVAVVRIEDVLRDVSRVDVVKIDVEGFEHAALSGYGELLRRHAPILLLEFSPALYSRLENDLAEKLISLLDQHSYRYYRTDGSLVQDLRTLARELRIRDKQCDLICIPRTRSAIASQAYLEDMLADYGPTRQLDELVEAVNALYHAAEARVYDDSHPEIFNQLPELYDELMTQAQSVLPERPLRVLDYGCGTGFASQQIVNRLGRERIRELICFDPVPEMLERCRANLRDLGVPVRWLSKPQQWDGIDVLVTNSVLHHLNDPSQTLRHLRPSMATGGIWIAGHEPSARFYRNPECVALLRHYKRRHRARQAITPGAYVKAATRLLGLSRHPAAVAARAAHERGWFLSQPSAVLISRLVDLHVAHSKNDVNAGRGLEVDVLARQLAGSWELLHKRSYSYLGDRSELEASVRVRSRCAELARKFPEDGANFCALWRAA